MKRIQRTELIVLKSEKSGENHRLVTMFTGDFGLVRALAFGAAGSKSAMRATTIPFCRAEGELYHDPVKDLWRISHLNGKKLYDGIRENLKKFYTVSFMSEVILKSYGGGDERVFRLFAKTLDLIDAACDEIEIEKLLVLYLWRYLWMNGVLPDLTECSSCGRDLGSQESLYYSNDGLFTCSSCRSGIQLELNQHALNYLYTTSTMTYEKALPVQIDESSFYSLKKCLILIVQALVEYPLKTLQSGRGFL
jgi:DNA repair protein RecO (recombination protein O)